MEVCREVRIIPLLVFNEVGRVPFLLAIPAVPEIFDTFLIARGADNSQGMEVDRTFDDVSRSGFFPVGKVRVTLEQAVLE